MLNFICLAPRDLFWCSVGLLHADLSTARKRRNWVHSACTLSLSKYL